MLRSIKSLQFGRIDCFLVLKATTLKIIKPKFLTFKWQIREILFLVSKPEFPTLESENREAKYCKIHGLRRNHFYVIPDIIFRDK